MVTDAFNHAIMYVGCKPFPAPLATGQSIMGLMQGKLLEHNSKSVVLFVSRWGTSLGSELEMAV
jgi:hypothetical protein